MAISFVFMHDFCGKARREEATWPRRGVRCCCCSVVKMVVHGGAVGDPFQLLENAEKQRWMLIASVAFNWGRGEVFSVSIDSNPRSGSKWFDDDGRPKRTGTVWTASAHIITAVIGSGVLSLASAIEVRAERCMIRLDKQEEKKLPGLGEMLAAVAGLS
ncbi:hypothetical protein NC653_008084 [Populus alba x Populus x berolinensis]|uniref:Uncharacterized protein n=1 Tax=Populus alba x Populus x berolinensis TaxID=444605 RepID=A0AAD6W819_9ROSI|nr:hypothetical protein NC653_008084 [Populus alba x Populus x berolinensis]